MPKVICSHCGEELMGSVNRCWRCGRTFVAEHNPENLPPIRRRPIPLDLVTKSWEELAAARMPARDAAGEEGNSGEPVVAEAIEPASADSALRGANGHSHPAFASAGAAAPVSTTPYYAAPPTPIYPSNAGATGGAIASIVLGVMALASIKLLTPGALLISILGVGMGVWGLHSDRRTAAVLGLLLCCLAMTLSGFFSAVQLYELINGYSPFEGDLPPVDASEL
jgi:hypothetical protein